MPASIRMSGNARVPLSTVVDQLRGRLTTAEIDAFVGALSPTQEGGVQPADLVAATPPLQVGMQPRVIPANPPLRVGVQPGRLIPIIPARQVSVQPGDLITAALVNQLLDDIADLQDRVAKLEGDKGVPVLSGRAPTGDIPLLGLLTVFGTGFDPTPSNNVVLLGGIAINSFVGTQNSTTQLSFQVPNQYPDVPKVVDLTLTRDGRISNALEVRLVPRVLRQAGPLLAISRTAPLPTIGVGTTFTLQWLINPQVTDTYSYRLLFYDCVGATADAWSATGRIAPTSPQPISNATPLLVAATVTAPSGFARAEVALEVVSSDGTKARTSHPMLLVLNQAPAVSDPRALVNVATTAIPAPDASNPLRTARLQVDDWEIDGLQLRFGASADVPIDVFATAQASAAGDYTYTATVEGGPWRVQPPQPPSNTAVPQAQNRRITVTLANIDTAQSSAISYLVVQAAHKPAGTGAVDFTSFARIPIQGFAA